MRSILRIADLAINSSKHCYEFIRIESYDDVTQSPVSRIACRSCRSLNMRIPTHRALLLLLACTITAGAGLAPALAGAQGGYPSKPIQLVLPFPPGGATDVVGRLVGQKLGELLGQTVIIDNRPGAGTIVGASFVAKSAPDGYTLMATSGTTFTVNPAIYPRLPYDPQKSFEPIGLIGSTGLILLANRDVPVNNLKEFVAAAKAEPGKYSYGSFGAGTTSHFAG